MSAYDDSSLVSPYADTCGHFCIRTSCRRQTQAPRISVRTSGIVPETQARIPDLPALNSHPSVAYS